MNAYAQFWFDTEDFITPEADDALYSLLVMLKERKVPTTFKLVAEKARVLQRRGRTDVIELLKDFAIGYHTEFHSMHPTIAEMCEVMGFAEGRDAFYARELPGLLDVENIVGKKCLCFGQPGNSWGPQTYPALVKMGIPVYMDAHNVIDGDGRPYWFGGMLNYLDIDLSSFHRMPLKPDGMQTARENFAFWARRHKDDEFAFMNIYYHPCEFSCTKFYDLNFARGYNPPREAWKPADLRDPGQMEILVAQLGEFTDFLREQEVAFITPSDLQAMEATRPGEVPREAVLAWAKGAAAGKVDAIVHEGVSLSCVEGLALAAKLLLGKPLTRSFAYGPDASEHSDFSRVVDTLSLARSVFGFFEGANAYAQLPVSFETGDARFSPLHAAVALSRALIHGETETPLHFSHAYLVPAGRVNPNADWSGWPIHTEDFRAHHILALARQQMWTYRPAVF